MKRLFDRPYLLLCLVMFFWGTNMVLGRAFADDLPPVTIAFIRWAGASLLAVPLAWPHLRRDWPLIRRHWLQLTVLGVTGVGLYNTMAYTGLRHTEALNGLLMQSSTPVFAMVWTFALFAERPSWNQLLGIALSSLGILTIATRGDLTVLRSFQFNVGDLWILAGLAVYTYYMASLRRRPAIHWSSFLAVTCLIGALTQLPLFAFERAAGLTPNFTIATLLVLAYVIVFPAFLAYVFLNRSIEMIGANRSAPFSHLMPVFGASLAVIFLGEQFRLFHLLGFAMVVGGVVVASRRKSLQP